jgi:hypothetical protein
MVSCGFSYEEARSYFPKYELSKHIIDGISSARTAKSQLRPDRKV